jgi:hypothetical protein
VPRSLDQRAKPKSDKAIVLDILPMVNNAYIKAIFKFGSPENNNHAPNFGFCIIELEPV